MYKLAGAGFLGVAWLTFFIMGLARVERTGNDGDGVGSTSVGDFYVPYEGTNCVCTGTECECDFAFDLGALRTGGRNCTECATPATGCRVCVLEHVLGSSCVCSAAVPASGGDGGDGADGGDGYARQAVALDGAGADGADGGAAADGADGAGKAPASTCTAGQEAKAQCSCTFGRAAAAPASRQAVTAADGDGDAKPAADGADGADGDAVAGAGPKVGNGFECCCTDAGEAKPAAGADGGDASGDARGALALDGADGADGAKTADADGGAAGNAVASGTCECKLPKAVVSSGGDGDAGADAGAGGDAGADGDARASQVLDGGDADGGDGGDAVAGDGDGVAAGPGVFRPKYGVLNGMGCSGRGGCSSATEQPYFVWAQFNSGDKHATGGQLYFEWRGTHGEVIAGLLLGWMGLLVVMTVVAVALRGKYQAPLCGPAEGALGQWADSLFVVPLRVTWGELLMNLWIVGWLVLCFLYVWNHAYINNLVGPVGRGFGGMVAGLLTLQLFPVSRRSVLLAAYGIPFERALRFHRNMGLWVVLLTLVHFGGMLGAHWQYYHYGEPVRPLRIYRPGHSMAEAGRLAMERMVEWEIGYPHGPPVAGFVSFIVMLLIVVTAFLRRKLWNVFAVTHTLYAVLYPLAWIHYPTLMIFSAIPVILYIADVLLRSLTDAATVEEVRPYPCGITRVTLRKRAFAYEAAQWVSVRLPGVEAVPGVAEWHPFSVSSVRSGADANGDDAGAGAGAPDDVLLTVHCKSMGDSEWTGRLRTHTPAPGSAAHVQGGFGRLTFNLARAENVLLCAGGVGVTPVLGLLSAAGRKTTPDNMNQHFTVVWTYRGAVRDAFADELAQLHKSGLDITWHLHDTAPVEDPEAGTENNAEPENVHVHAGRPDWGAYMDAATSPPPRVFVCGPGPVALAVEREAVSRNLQAHAEVFEL